MEDQTSVIAITGKEKYATRLSKGPWAWMTDEPVSQGGGGLAPSPPDMFAGALSACMTITARMYADRKGWPMESIQVKTHFLKEGDGYTLTTSTTISGDELTDEQRKRLVDIANRCPMHKLMEKCVTMVETSPFASKQPA